MRPAWGSTAPTTIASTAAAARLACRWGNELSDYEYLAVRDEAAFFAATSFVPKFASSVDPAARWTCANGGQTQFSYCTAHLIDLKDAVIIDIETWTVARHTEMAAWRLALKRSALNKGSWMNVPSLRRD